MFTRLCGISAIAWIAAEIAEAQCGSTWVRGPAPAVNGVNGPIYASLSWDHDNNPGTANWLVVGGQFTIAGTTRANNLAAWDGSRWHSFGLGLVSNQASVRSLAVYNGQLVVGGRFDTADAVVVNNLARWNGTTFESIGGGVGGGSSTVVNAIVVHPGTNNLFVGGQFTTAGAGPALNVARWNGSSWFALGSGVGEVNALRIYGNLVVAGGNFPSDENVATWNGVNWTRLGGPFPCLFCFPGGCCASVSSLLVMSNGVLYAGGSWARSDAMNSHGLARYREDLGEWDDEGDDCAFGLFSCFPSVRAMVEYEGALIAGDRSYSGSRIGGGVNGDVFSLCVHNGDLYAAGSFSNAGEDPNRVSATNIARWNGSNWSAIAPPTPVRAMTQDGSTLVAGGDFIWPTSTATTDYIAGYDDQVFFAYGYNNGFGLGVRFAH